MQKVVRAVLVSNTRTSLKRRRGLVSVLFPFGNVQEGGWVRRSERLSRFEIRVGVIVVVLLLLLRIIQIVESATQSCMSSRPEITSSFLTTCLPISNLAASFGLRIHHGFPRHPRGHDKKVHLATFYPSPFNAQGLNSIRHQFPHRDLLPWHLSKWH